MRRTRPNNPACLNFAKFHTPNHGSAFRGILFAFFCLLFLTQMSHAQAAGVEWPQISVRLSALLSGDPEQKRTALGEIRNLETEEAARLALPALRDADEIVRATAASAVVFLPETEARDALLPLLGDRRPFVRREAAFALGKVGNWGASAQLRRLLLSDRDPEVRSAAAIALGGIGDPSAIGDLLAVLEKRLREEDEFLRRSAARAIGQTFELHYTGQTEAVTPQNFLSPSFKKMRPAVTKNAPQVDLARVMATLTRVLRNSDEADDTRRAAAFALGAARQPAAAAALRPFLNSPDPYLVEICKEALIKIENEE
ncbi:MAG TPA: HEAT repeat domain-containing protein [Pyrinomonadaceae bacterium]|nr:HEAT repeat domain-containing protein [Pyrinomonadaceae bacterium]